ncbi:MAG: ABC transporter permease [Aristaeellaceae bacterium]
MTEARYSRRVSLIRDIARNPQLYLLMLPGAVFILIFSYVPIMGYVLAFKQYNIAQGIWGSPFVGLKNFRFFFAGKDWLRVTGNTIVLNLLFIVCGMGLSVLFSLMINEIHRPHLRKLVQSSIFLPYFISWLVVDRMLYALLATNTGLINQLLTGLGLTRLNFYNTPGYWRTILTLVYVFKNAGYYSVIFLGSITSLDTAYYESAIIDGATRLQVMFRITLPLIRTTILTMLLLAVGRIFYGDFGMIYGLVGDNSTLFPTTDVIDTYSYRALRQLGNFSMSSAITLYQSAFGIIIVCIFNALVKKIDPDVRLF